MSKLKNGYAVKLSIERLGEGVKGIELRLDLLPGEDKASAEAMLNRWLEGASADLWASAMRRSEPEATCESLLEDAAKWMAVLSRNIRIEDFPEGVLDDMSRWIGEVRDYFARKGI